MVPALLLFNPGLRFSLRIQGLLLLYGAYLAGLTDHVSSPPVNQSLTIMVGVNLVVLAAGLLLVVTRYLHSWPNLVFGLTSGGIFVCTTTINCFIFIPQVCSKEKLAGPVLQSTGWAWLPAHCVFSPGFWVTFIGESEGRWVPGELAPSVLPSSLSRRRTVWLPISTEGSPEWLGAAVPHFHPWH